MRLPSPRLVYTTWRDFRAHQIQQLRESNRPAHPHDDQFEQFDDDLADLLPDFADEPEEVGTPYGEVGKPLNRHSPFYIGFVGATGVVAAITLWRALGEITTTLTLLAVAFFLTLALNPLVEWLSRTYMRRRFAVGLVFSLFLVAFVALGFLVIPPVVREGSELVSRIPGYVEQLLQAQWVRDLDRDNELSSKVQTEVSRRLTDQAFIGQVLGGLLGAGRFVVSGIFQTLTVLILTLYFLAALPRMKHAAYAMVPASRRARVMSLGEEMMRRVGSYAIGQVFIATINAVLSWMMMQLFGVPYAAVLAVSVGLLGLVPMVGATLGAALVCLVAFFHEPKLALVFAVYYLVYQQIENYLIAPRVMQRTVSVPGAVTIVAALVGGTLLGVLGALLAIPVAAGLLLLYEEILVPRQRHA